MTRKKSNRTTAEIKAMMAEEGDFLRPICGDSGPLKRAGASTHRVRTCSAIDLRLASWVCLKAIE